MDESFKWMEYSQRSWRALKLSKAGELSKSSQFAAMVFWLMVPNVQASSGISSAAFHPGY